MKTGPLTALSGMKTATLCIETLGEEAFWAWERNLEHGYGVVVFPTPSSLVWNLALSTLLMHDPHSQVPSQPYPSLSCSCEIIATDQFSFQDEPMIMSASAGR